MTDHDQLIEKPAVRPQEPRREPRGAWARPSRVSKSSVPSSFTKRMRVKALKIARILSLPVRSGAPLTRTIHILQIVFPAVAREMGLDFLREFQRVFKAP